MYVGSKINNQVAGHFSGIKHAQTTNDNKHKICVRTYVRANTKNANDTKLAMLVLSVSVWCVTCTSC